MATITINGETLTIKAHLLYCIANAARNDLSSGFDDSREASITHDEAEKLEDFCIDALNNPPTHYHAEGHRCGQHPVNERYGHYIEQSEWLDGRYNRMTLCRASLVESHRVDMLSEESGAPTPSKPMCPECKEIHDAIERWE